ncbi:PKD domain-containing protein [Branchiibius cervicis]|uniref:PKD domain-containing protein n=1 Tax=Branchiibius cervicis TaxID=908252 RepID=A0ABW2AQQ0_9MICO
MAALLTPLTAARADTSPIADRPTGLVTADSLPTAQINGIAWAQAVSGDTVFVGGKFTSARPAGAAAGTNETSRNNLMAYSISTGVMTSWNPNANGQILAMALSPDGSRLYVAGSFTTIGGRTANRIAALDPATGALISSFNVTADSQVTSLAVTNSAVYFGGIFSTVNNTARSRVAAVSATTGALLPWNPGADAKVYSMTMNPSKSLVIVGGSFDQIGGQSATGLGALDPTTGARVYWAATDTVTAWGVTSQGGAAIYSLSTDGSNVYGTAYNYYGYGNLEGTFSADGNTGAINWVEDCHGDTYGVFANDAAVYTVSHAHYCANIGGFPQSDPWSTNMRHALAFTKQATGTIAHDTMGYHDWYGTASPSLINWFPDIAVGTLSGQSQAAWAINGNSNYVVVGGEFPTINGGAQAGLGRFAVPSKSTNKQGPRLGGTNWVPTVTALSNTVGRVSIPANWDRDNSNLTYSVVRGGKVVYTTTATSQFWNTPTISFMDTGLTAGQTYNYYVKATDADGNANYSQTVSVTMPTNLATSAYLMDVLNDGASNYWRLGETSGTTATDIAGSSPMTASGATQGAAGALLNDSNTAYSFAGSSSSFASTQTPVVGPNLFTSEVWFQTTSTSGGKILGFGSSNTGNSSSYDRHLYMTPSGQVVFGVYNNAVSTVTSPKTYNDGKWHYAVASLSSAGMVLYLDGKKVGTNTTATAGQPFSGYWRLGGDNLGGWPGSSNGYFAGAIDEAAIYPTALTPTQIQQHYTDSGRTVPTVTAPADAYGKAVFNDQPDVYYRMTDTTTKATDVSGNGNDGLYSGGYTQGAAGSPTGGGSGVTFDGSSGTLGSAGPVVGPSTYTEESWFKTTTTAGGKIMGFGDQQTGNSGNYDRHVYMLPSGQLVFGTWTGQTNLATSSAAYNDGNWHYVVATQGSDGMTLYVDGVVVATNAQTSQQAYNGYWRVGGDSSWAGSNYFAGTIDEAAFYSSELSPRQIAAHYNAATVNHAPTASFTATASGLTASVDGSASSDPDTGDSVASYVWDFGDGSQPVTTTTPTTSHTYSAGGSYTITLTVKDSSGTASTATTHAVTVAAPPANVPPVAAFTSSVAHNVASFDGSGSSDSDGTVASYDWDFGDGSTHATTAKPNHTYTSAGSYNVTLTVTDNQGATNSVTKSITVGGSNQAPAAAFTSSVAGRVASFDGTGSSDSDGTVASYDWDFGDGSTHATTAKPNHTYTSAGSYNVTLTVTDNDGATGSVTHSVTVVNQPPTAAFTSSVAHNVASFDGTGSSDSDGTVASYDWDFGDGSTHATTAKPNHTYTSAGSYNVTLTVTDNDGGTNALTKTVTVGGANQPPTVVWSSSVSGLVATFSSAGTTDADGTVAGLSWDFGDGSGTSTSANPSYTYTRSGTYQVTLTATDNDGAKTSVTHAVTIANQPPTASFKATANQLAVAFDSSASSDPENDSLTYAWDFGDGSGTSTAANPNYTYGTAGTYTVKLTVNDGHGNSASTSRQLTVSAVPADIATDTFTRTTTNGWGTADKGGAWTLSGTASKFATNGNIGTMTATGPGNGQTAYLNGVSAADINWVLDTSVPTVATGGGYYITLMGRHTSTGEYRLKLLYQSTGSVQLLLTKVVSGTETSIKTVSVAGLTYTGGDVLRIRFTIKGSALTGTVWKATGTEPTSPQLTASDSTAALQPAGSIALQSYLSGSVTNAPVMFSYDNLSVKPN